MTRTPLIELQRRLAEAGRIRMGEKTEKGAPKRLNTWRITSPDKDLIEQAAALYGGTPQPWQSPTGPQHEVVTTTAELPVLVMPGYSFTQTYEFRTSPTLVERRCDGLEMADGAPCLCNANGLDGDDACDLLTRLTVALPELTTLLGWRLESKGDNAARELLASMDLIRGVAGGRPFVPAKLRIVERRGNVNGQAVRFVVPVIDVQVRYQELGVGEERAALPAGYTPLQAPLSGVSLADGLQAAETQTVTRTPRSAAPIPAATDLEFTGAPLPEPDAPIAEQPESSTAGKPLTKAQATKLNVLVGKLRDQREALKTDHLWAALANMRNFDVEHMIDQLDGRDDDGLHWSPLRDSLTRAEASALIERLQAKEDELEAEEAAVA